MGIKEMEVTSAAAVLQLLESGNQMRHQAATSANAESSRSHAVFVIIVEQSETEYVDSSGASLRCVHLCCMLCIVVGE